MSYMHQLIIIHHRYFRISHTSSSSIKLNKFREKVRKSNTTYLVLLLRRLRPNKNSAPRRPRFNEKIIINGQTSKKLQVRITFFILQILFEINVTQFPSRTPIDIIFFKAKQVLEFKNLDRIYLHTKINEQVEHIQDYNS